jgi:uncharacterized membrane-anchored protein
MRNNRKIIAVVFVLVALVQIYVPASMILGREEVLHFGTEYRFKAAPVDPNDPFRGKYITLQYEQNSIPIEDGAKWESGETVFIILTTDSAGMVKFESAVREKPANQENYLQTKVWYVSSNSLVPDLPFDRFYMEESKAYDAELAYNESLIDTAQVTYALVGIKNGEAVLKDVFINDVSIREIVKTRQQRY